MPSGAERRPPFWPVVLAIAALDRVTKMVAEGALADGRTAEGLGELLRFRLIYNPGASFGMHVGEASRWLFLAIAVIGVVILARMHRASAPADRLKRGALAVIAAGAMGNGLDRILSPAGVIDYIDLGIGGLRFPWLFNVADVAVNLGAAVLFVVLWREDHPARAATPVTHG